jgi:hypothetical protein
MVSQHFTMTTIVRTAALLIAAACGASDEYEPAPAAPIAAGPAAPEMPPQPAAEPPGESTQPVESPSTAGAGALVPGGSEPAQAAPGTGVLRGRVVFAGKTPARAELAGPTATAGCQHHDGPVLAENVIVNDGRLANVVVFVKKGLGDGQIPPPPAEPLVLDQKGCVYTPHVVALRAGQPFVVRNSDAVTHNVNWRPKRNDPNNAAQAQGSPPVEGRFERAEMGVPIGCDLHPWMKAWMCVFDHPYFAISGADGSFTIHDVPAGSYEIGAWHEVYRDEWSSAGKKFAISEGLATAIEITFAE